MKNFLIKASEAVSKKVLRTADFLVFCKFGAKLLNSYLEEKLWRVTASEPWQLCISFSFFFIFTINTKRFML